MYSPEHAHSTIVYFLKIKNYWGRNNIISRALSVDSPTPFRGLSLPFSVENEYVRDILRFGLFIIG